MPFVALCSLILLLLCACSEQNDFVGLDGSTSNFYVRNEMLYFLRDNDLTAMRYNTSDRKLTVIADDIASAAFSGDSIYFIEHSSRSFSIYKQSLDTGEKQLIRGGGVSEPSPGALICDNVISVQNELFYTTRYPARLYRYDEQDILIAEFPDSDGSLRGFHTDGRILYCTYRKEGARYISMYLYDLGSETGNHLTETQ